MQDSDLQRDVVAELNRDPSVDADRMIVMVDGDVVTLGGWVHTCSQKCAAERVARGIPGVRLVINALDVRLLIRDARSDAAIKCAATEVLAWNAIVPEGRVRVEVNKGWLTLRGDVDWPHELAAAEDAVRNLIGVRGISNDIVIMWHHDDLGRAPHTATAR